MVSSMAGGDEVPAGGGRGLAGFRRGLHCCLWRRGEALFELTEAVLTARGLVASLPYLSLEPGFRRGHGMVYLGLAEGRIDEEALRDLLVAARPADWPLVFAIGASTYPPGSSLFDQRYGLGALKPRRLTAMPPFPNNALEPGWLHGDLLIQLCAHHPDTLHHAIRDLAKHTRGGMQLRWKIEGYNSPPRPSGTSRNLLGFKDGTANPAGALASSLVWVGDPAEPSWAHDGAYQVVRLIRMLVEFWDRVSINEQENMFGRRRDSGAPLDWYGRRLLA